MTLLALEGDAVGESSAIQGTGEPLPHRLPAILEKIDGMTSGKISVFATTNETSLPITFTKIEKEHHEMAVTDIFFEGI